MWERQEGRDIFPFSKTHGAFPREKETTHWMFGAWQEEWEKNNPKRPRAFFKHKAAACWNLGAEVRKILQGLWGLVRMQGQSKAVGRESTVKTGLSRYRKCGEWGEGTGSWQEKELCCHPRSSQLCCKAKWEQEQKARVGWGGLYWREIHDPALKISKASSEFKVSSRASIEPRQYGSRDYLLNYPAILHK